MTAHKTPPPSKLHHTGSLQDLSRYQTPPHYPRPQLQGIIIIISVLIIMSVITLLVLRNKSIIILCMYMYHIHCVCKYFWCIKFLRILQILH